MSGSQSYGEEGVEEFTTFLVGIGSAHGWTAAPLQVNISHPALERLVFLLFFFIFLFG